MPTLGVEEQTSINLCLTKACNKCCTFCFMDNKSKDTEMSVEFIQKVMTHFRPVRTRLIGGEPTQHSRFIDILKLLESKKQLYSLITNLLFSDEIREALLAYGNSRYQIMANGMELDEGDRMARFAKNIGGLPVGVIALTICETSTVEGFVEYVRYLKQELPVVPERVRIGLDLCGTWMLNNTNIGRIVKAIQQELPDHTLFFDCQFPLCVWDFDPVEELNFGAGEFLCRFPAMDVFHDGSAIYCYPAKKFRVDDVFEYESCEALARALRSQYRAEERKVDVPDECLACENYLWSKCPAICLGCYRP